MVCRYLWGKPPQSPKEAAEKIQRQVCNAIVLLLVLGSVVVPLAIWDLFSNPLLPVVILAFGTAMYALVISAAASSYQLQFKNYGQS